MKINQPFIALVSIVILFIFSCQKHSNDKELLHITFNDFSNFIGIDTLKTKLVEQHLLANKEQDTLVLEILEDLIGDPQLYNIINLKGNNAVYELKNVQGFKIDSNTKINLSNLVDSELIFVTENNKSEKLLFIWDYQYPDCSNLFEIIKVTQEKPIKIFSEEILVKEIDIDVSKTFLNIIGLKSCGEIQKEFKIIVE